MAQNKKSLFNKNDVAIAEIARVLSHPARIAIIKTLIKKDTCICGEIVKVMPLAQSTVSQHLKELKNAGIIKGTIEGLKSCYCLDHDRLKEFESLLMDFFDEITAAANTTCCKN